MLVENNIGKDRRYTSSKSEVYLQNYAALNTFFHSALQQLNTMKTADPTQPQERRLVNSIEDMFTEGDNFSLEGERLETKGEMALSLAFFTNAASKFKQITLLNNVAPDEMLRAQIRREGCLKKARTMYRRLLVQSAQRSQNQTENNNLRSNKKTNQVRSERRPCSTCSKPCFWLKDGLCSDCDLRANEIHHRRNPSARRNVSSRSAIPREPARTQREPPRMSRAVPRDFTRPRPSETQSYIRRPYNDSEQSSSSEEEFAPVKSCAICHTHRQHNPSTYAAFSQAPQSNQTGYPAYNRRRCC